MADSRFRRTWQGDDSDNCECLTCKASFSTGTGESYTFCPHCGIKFKGEFTKRHERLRPETPYRTVDVYKTDPDGMFIQSVLPRLVIEYGRWEAVEKRGYIFQRDKSYEVKLRWHSSSHTEMNPGTVSREGPYGTPVSPFSHLFFQYKLEEADQRSSYHCLRLVVVTKKGRRVIRELTRYVDHEKLIAEQIRRDKMPRSSGVGVSG